jgi:hypothetical protein
MSPDTFLRNTWTDILGTGGRFPPEHLDTFPGIRTRDYKGDFSHLEIEYAGLATFSNPEFPSYTLLVFRPFILYNQSKMA